MISKDRQERGAPWPAPSRFSGDPQNDVRALTKGYAWASWDNGQRNATVSMAPTGEVSGAGWEPGCPGFPWGPLDTQEERAALWEWLTA